jgi:hypothetical protein
MRLSQSIVKRTAVVALLLSGAVGALQIFACWYSVAPRGSDFLLRHFSTFFMGYFVILAFSNVLYAIGDAFNLLFRRGKSTWQQLAAKLVLCAVIFVVVILAFGLGETIRHEAFKRIAVRGKPLIVAIRQYQLKQGSPPGELADLVPDYLPSIPGTGVGAYPNYEFITKGAPARYGGNAWVLTVDVSTDDLVHDAVVYYPNTNYPSRKEVPISRRIGDWAYVSVARSSESK